MTASALKNAGLSVLVLEARNRMGGRIHTFHGFDKPLDLGAR